VRRAIFGRSVWKKNRKITGYVANPPENIIIIIIIINANNARVITIINRTTT